MKKQRPLKPTNWFLKGLSELWWREQITLSVFMDGTKTIKVTSVSLFEVGLEWTCSAKTLEIDVQYNVFCWMQSEGSSDYTPLTDKQPQKPQPTQHYYQGSGFSWLDSLLLVDAITTSLSGQNSIYWWPEKKERKKVVHSELSKHQTKKKTKRKQNRQGKKRKAERKNEERERQRGRGAGQRGGRAQDRERREREEKKTKKKRTGKRKRKKKENKEERKGKKTKKKEKERKQRRKETKKKEDRNKKQRIN